MILDDYGLPSRDDSNDEMDTSIDALRDEDETSVNGEYDFSIGENSKVALARGNISLKILDFCVIKFIEAKCSILMQ